MPVLLDCLLLLLLLLRTCLRGHCLCLNGFYAYCQVGIKHYAESYLENTRKRFLGQKTVERK